MEFENLSFIDQQIKMGTIVCIQLLNEKLIYPEETFNDLKNIELEDLERKRDHLVFEYNNILRENPNYFKENNG
jgi:hypothetical protein